MRRLVWCCCLGVALIAAVALALNASSAPDKVASLAKAHAQRAATSGLLASSSVSGVVSAQQVAVRTDVSKVARRPGAVVERAEGPSSAMETTVNESRSTEMRMTRLPEVSKKPRDLRPEPLSANVPELNFSLPEESEDRGHSTLDATCVLTNSGSPYWLWTPEEGDVIKVWFPRVFCGANTSPFRIDSVGFFLYTTGAGTLVFQVDIECPTTPYDSTTGPAYELSHPDSNWYSITFPTGGGSGWVNVKLHPSICVNHGFFAGLRFGSWSGTSATFPRYATDELGAVPWGRQWWCTPGCCDWRSFVGSTYRISARVRGNTGDACSPVACTTPPCVVTCQTGDSIEATETADSTWMSHDPNGGCMSSPPLFGHAPCGSWVCGKLFTYETVTYYFRDWDWYTFTLTQRDSVHLTVISEFPVLAGIVDTNNCTDWAWIAVAEGSSNCTTRVRTGCLDAGTYAFLVAPASYYCPAAPGADYRARVECFLCGTCPPPPNDDCADAFVIPCDTTDVQVDLNCATQDCDSLTAREVWYKFYLDPTEQSEWSVGISYCGTDPGILSIGAILYSACPCSGSFTYTGVSSFACVSPSWLPDTLYFENVPAGWWYLPVYTNLGTTVVFDLACSGYVPCTPASANDSCANVTPLTLPATFTDDNTCATHDCDSLTYGEGETWHAFTIDQQCNVIVDYCGTDTSHFSIFYTILVQTCPCTTATYPTVSDFTTCGDGAISMRFDYLQPGTYYLPVLRSDLDETGGPYTIHVYCAAACTLICPGGALAENEPPCSADYVDVTNGGCNSTPPVFATLSCGQTVCGTSGTFVWQDTLRRRDTDWYRVTLTQQAYITWSAVGEFPPALFVFDSTDCDSARLLASNFGFACDTVTATTAVLPPGEYWLVVAPDQFEYVDCGVDYIAWVTCTPCDVVCLASDSAECAETPGPAHSENDCNGGCFNDPGAALYQNIVCGQSTCGIGFTYNPTDSTVSKDTDWYHFALTDSQQVSVTVEAEFPVDVYVLNYDCGDIQVLAYGYSDVPCAPVTVVTATALPPGDYTVMVTPQYEWFVDRDGRVMYPSYYRMTLGCPCVPAIKATVYLDASVTNLVVRWVAPAAGAYKVFSTVSKTASFDPLTWTVETTLTVGSGTNEWTDPAATVPYKRYVVQHVCQ